MNRRSFLETTGLATAALTPAIAAEPDAVPSYHIVTPYKPAAHYERRGQVVRVHAANCINEANSEVDASVVGEMMRRGMTSLTGDRDVRDSWRRFFGPSDVVGIKLNCSGAPNIKSHPVVVAETINRLVEVGVKPQNITLYERFPDQVSSVNYPGYIRQPVNIFTAEPSRGQLKSYDPRVYVEVNFFGEDDTRSNMIRLITEQFTKIVNIPNIKDHGASGVTGCLKNIAYGSFHNVARSHAFSKTHTKTFIGTLASVEPLRSKTVLHVMDGLKGVWHGGPFLRDQRYAFFPKQMLFGTDPVAMDRIMRDVVEAQRKKENAVSVFDRSPEITKKVDPKDPNTNRYVREPGHIEYAATLGLGVVEMDKIKLEEIRL